MQQPAVFQRTFLRASLWIAGIVWIELLGCLSMMFVGHLRYFANLPSGDRLGLMVLSLGWPFFYGLSLAIIFVVGLYAQGGSEFKAPSRESTLQAGISRHTLNWTIIAFPSLVAVVTAVGTIQALTGNLAP